MTNDEQPQRRYSDANIDISAPGGFRAKVSGMTIEQVGRTIEIAGISLIVFILWLALGILQQLVLSNDRLTLVNAQVYCVLRMPIDVRFEQFGQNTYCEAYSRKALRDMKDEDEAKLLLNIPKGHLKHSNNE